MNNFQKIVDKRENLLDYIWANQYNTSDGDDREKDPPVIIPNTVVKLLIADDTWLEATRKIRTLPSHH